MELLTLPDLSKQIGKAHLETIAKWLNHELHKAQNEFNNAPAESIYQNQGKVQALKKLLLDIRSVVTAP